MRATAPDAEAGDDALFDGGGVHVEDGDVLLERFLAQWFDGAPIESAEELEL